MSAGRPGWGRSILRSTTTAAADLGELDPGPQGDEPEDDVAQGGRDGGAHLAYSIEMSGYVAITSDSCGYRSRAFSAWASVS